MTAAVKLPHVVGRHYRTGRLVELEMYAGTIAWIRELPDDGRQHPWVAPGFIDIQSNGYGGQEFSSPALTVDKVAEIASRQAEFGVTQFLPTVTTASGDTIRHSLRTIAAACREFPDVAHTIPGIHVEGPYIATAEGPRGAHPLEHCRPPDWHEFQSFQEAAEGRVRLLTLSPEYAEAPDFIRRAVASGVVISIGHTSADSAQIRAAVAAGARLSTHLGNGAHRMLRRHPNYLWDQLADDRLMASLIVDGHHLPREVVQTMVRAKTPARCILVSDLSGLAGLPPGRYATELCELDILDDGRLVIAGQDQLLAGASLPISDGVANVMAFAGVDLATAVDMATLHPAELLGLKPNRLNPGDAADLTLFELREDGKGKPQRLVVTATISRGEMQRIAAS
jgi:N-acetylglucosamine-6-phosphate deacetylase